MTERVQPNINQIQEVSEHTLLMDVTSGCVIFLARIELENGVIKRYIFIGK